MNQKESRGKLLYKNMSDNYLFFSCQLPVNRYLKEEKLVKQNACSSGS